MDLTKVTPAPWHVEEFDIGVSITYGPADDASDRYALDDPMERPDCEFCALARNAFDVMLRRKWSVEPYGNNWYAAKANERVDSHDTWPVIPWSENPSTFADPFTCLVEADRWTAQNEIANKNANS